MRPIAFVRRAGIVTLVALVCAASGVRAEKADRDKPINYSADVGDVNIQTKVGTLTGSVVITQGTLTIRADRVVFRQNPDNSLSATAWGNPVSFRQKRDGADEYYEGFALRGEYDGTKEVLQLFDRAILRRGGDEIHSNFITYNAGNNLFKAEGRPSTTGTNEPGGPGNRVRGVFQPKAENPAPATPAKAAAPRSAEPAVNLKAAGDLAPPKSK